MNYCGINKKVKVKSTNWEGPKARLAAKEIEAKRQEWLNEVIEHKISIKGDGDGWAMDNMMTHIHNRYRDKSWRITRKLDNPFELDVRVTAPRGELIEEGLINE